jgi:dihydroorotase
MDAVFPMKQLLQGGRILDPATGLDQVADVLLEGNQIAAIGPAISPSEADHVLHLTPEHWVTPGLIDIHVHFRDPGRPDKETTASGAAAAIEGGFTAVCVMPNTTPPLDNLQTLQYVQQTAKTYSPIHIYPVAAATKGLAGEDLTPMGGLFRCGAVGFTDDGHCLMNANLMRLALEYSQMVGAPFVCHAEDMNLTKQGVMHEGYWSTFLGLPGIPNMAESVIVSRDIELAKLTGGRVHFAHINTRQSVELIRKAKAEGIPVTAETAPHYLVLTDAACQHYDPNFKMNGPLRSEADRQALIAGLQDGTLDVIATDHAPHNLDEKSLEFDKAPFGVIGLETSLGVMLTHFVHTGLLGPMDLVRLMSTRPAQVMNLPTGGRLEVGQLADVTVIDPNMAWTVDPLAFKSKSRNTPFDGWPLRGRAVAVFAQGACVLNRLDATQVASGWPGGGCDPVFTSV